MDYRKRTPDGFVYAFFSEDSVMTIAFKGAAPLDVREQLNSSDPRPKIAEGVGFDRAAYDADVDRLASAAFASMPTGSQVVAAHTPHEGAGVLTTTFPEAPDNNAL